jgi:electron transfer flavoprotein alpha subunit
MANTLVIIETFKGELKKASLPTVTAAKVAASGIGGDAIALVIGKGLDGAAEAVAKTGVAKVIYAEGDAVEHYLAESFATVAAKVAEDNDVQIVLAPATTFGKDLLPRVATKIGAAMVSESTGISIEGGKMLFNRPLFAGNVDATVEVLADKAVSTVRGTAFEPAGEDGSAAVEKIAAEVGDVKAKYVEFQEAVSDRPELTEAQVVVSGGRGFKDPDNFKKIEPLADLFNAGIGATRAAVDGGFCPNDWQVGQTGKVVAPKLYFAIGISGAIQHWAGMKDSKTIVAINKDAEAPIFTFSDYGIVGDLFKILPDLEEQLKKAME